MIISQRLKGKGESNPALINPVNTTRLFAQPNLSQKYILYIRKLFDYKISVVDSQHENINSKGDFEFKSRF